MSTPRLDLEKYGLSRSLGFLSDSTPSASFSDSRFSRWDELVNNLPELISCKSLRHEINDLPQLDVSELSTVADQRRAYVVLAFLVHGYVWMDLPHEIDQDAAIVPPQLAEPFLATCRRVGMEPVLSYAGLCLWNWSAHGATSPLASADFELEGLTSLGSFTGARAEDAFYHVPVLVEAEGGPLVSLLADAVQSCEHNDVHLVTQALRQCAETISRMKSHLPKLYSTLEAGMFYHQLRPFLSGGKGMENKGLPRGFVFRRDDGSCQEVKCAGGSAAQSSLFQYLDLVLGVKHESSSDTAENLFQVMRAYMPKQHREFLSAVSRQPSVRAFVEATPDAALRYAYNDCLKQLQQWRSSHIAVVSRYIVRPARNTDAASPDSSENSDDALKGTAGSSLIPFLKQAREETIGV